MTGLKNCASSTAGPVCDAACASARPAPPTHGPPRALTIRSPGRCAFQKDPAPGRGKVDPDTAASLARRGASLVSLPLPELTSDQRKALREWRFGRKAEHRLWLRACIIARSVTESGAYAAPLSAFHATVAAVSRMRVSTCSTSCSTRSTARAACCGGTVA